MAKLPLKKAKSKSLKPKMALLDTAASGGDSERRLAITAGVARDIVGNRIDVSVNATSGSLSRVLTKLDGSNLADDATSASAYQRLFRQAGTAAPGMSHTLVVRGTRDDGVTEELEKRWDDDN